MAVKMGDRTVMAESLYPKEGNPLWEQYSTRTVAHTLKSYSSYTFDYPYPKAVSVNAEDQGMEYPMICWNFGRPDANGKTSNQTKFGMIGVIIHEIGHNYFPMIVNSDERQWTWMDEGLTTFLQYLTEQTFPEDFPSRRGPARLIVPYMKGDQQGLEPVMTNSESIRQFGNNAYAKPATALNILRETVMGHELFDYAFKTYANRWKFKHPTPEDFFRTMEDASAVDLDWYWRGWFYTTDYTDIGIQEVKQFTVTDKLPKGVTVEQPSRRRRFNLTGPMVYLTEVASDVKSTSVNVKDIKPLKEYLASNFSQKEIASFKNPKYFYQVTFDKPGGLVMPLIVDLILEDGTVEKHRFPAQIWQMNDNQVTRTFATEKPISKIIVDAELETADIDVSNNTWPKQVIPSKFD
jgi:aminopeptidase N